MAAPAIAKAAQQLGAEILTGCAARGIERSAGRVSGVITERGPIKCRSVVLAGGAWSSLFCKALGVPLPQLKVQASVLRTAPVEGGPSIAAWGPGLSLRRRIDGGYTVSHGSAIAAIVPDSFRYFGDFLPLLKAERAGISFRLGRSFLQEWRWEAGWPPDAPSPFEGLRMLDPMPSSRDLRRARANLERAFPVFKGVATLATWAGAIDVTPDLLPVISEVPGIPGFFLSTGYSGHGFGIGPGAGLLTANLVMGAKPIVDPTPFHYSRFADGAKVSLRTGL